MSTKKLLETDPSNVRMVSVPLEIPQIKEFFENKELFFVVDYSKGKIKGSMFLTYLANLELPCEIYLGETPKEEIYSLLATYMETRNMCSFDALNLTVGQIMLVNRGIATDSFIQSPILTEEMCREFIAAHKDIVEKWDTFLESSLVYMLTSNQVLEGEFKFKAAFEVVDDALYIGNNVVQLFGAPAFLELFMSKPLVKEPKYFRAQFEEYMFRGKNFFEYFCVPENTLYSYFLSYLEGNLDDAKVDSVLGEKV